LILDFAIIGGMAETVKVFDASVLIGYHLNSIGVDSFYARDEGIGCGSAGLAPNRFKKFIFRRAAGPPDLMII